MKLRGYRPRSVGDGVEVWECTTLELPVGLVLQEYIVSAEPRPWLDRDGPGDGDVATLPERNGPIGYRGPGGEECRVDEGLVVGFSFTALIDFLSTRYMPLAKGAIEHLCQRLLEEKLPLDKFRREVERLLNEMNDICRRMPPSRRSRDWFDSPILFRDTERLAIKRLETEAGPAVFPNTDHVVLSREFTVDRRGVRIPRRAWVLVPKWRTEPVLHWDGERAACLPRSHLRRSAFLEPFDRDGTSLIDLPVACVGAPELQPLFLLRVPSKRQLETVAERPPDEPILRSASFLLDSRAAVPLPSAGADVPVVTDPGVARYVLARTTPFGAYVPSAPPSATFPDCAEGDVRIGALPRMP